MQVGPVVNLRKIHPILCEVIKERLSAQYLSILDALVMIVLTSEEFQLPSLN